MGYSTDLTDAEWKIIAPLLPKKWKINKIKWDKRLIFDAILFQLKNGCNWTVLPKDSALFRLFITITVSGVRMANSTKSSNSTINNSGKKLVKTLTIHL